MSRTQLEETILARITPSEEDLAKAQSLADRLMSTALFRARERGIVLDPLLVGSLAKGTFLTDVDIDVFLMFYPDTSRENLQKWGLEIGHILVPDGEERYAEHPYVHGWVEGYEIDVVPCYKLASTSEQMSAVDRTPFHTRYILENLANEQKPDVLLLKKFMKGVGVYGAEASVGGFSGYLCELLVLHFGGFRNVLEAFVSMKPNTVLTLEEPAGKKFSRPLVFVDPVDRNRNVAAALTKQSLAVFQHASIEYISDPKEEFFFPNKPKPLAKEKASEMFGERGTVPLLVTAPLPDLVEDVFYPQLLKMQKTLVERCDLEGFPVVSSARDTTEGELYILLELERGERSQVRKHIGPPMHSEHASSFLDKWVGRALNGPYLEKGHWVAEVQRELVQAEEVVSKGLVEWGIGKDLGTMATNGDFRVYAGEDAVQTAPALLLTQLLRKKFPWEQ